MRKRFTIFLFLSLLTHLALAQYLSNNGDFSVSEKKGCAPLTITYTNLKAGACTAGAPCDVRFEVVNTITDCQTAFSSSTATKIQNPSLPYTFTQPGTYRIITLYQGDCDEMTVTVTESIQPAFDIYTCSGNQVQVVVTDTNYDSYIIDYNDGSPMVPVPSGSLARDQHTYATSGNKTISVRGKDVNAADNCAVNTKPVIAVAGLAAPFINSLVANDNGTDIDVAFTGLPNTVYRLEIAVNSTSNFQLIKSVHDVSSITVNNLRTDDNYYCFRLAAYDPCNGTSVYSNTICSLNLDVAAEDNQNALTWQTGTPAGTVFDITRDNQPIASTTDKFLDDQSVICNQTYVYQVTANYGNGSTSTSSNESVTSISSTIPTGIPNVTAVVTINGVDLSWQPDPVFIATSYRIEKKSGTAASYSFNGSTTITTHSDPTYSTTAESCYRITYTDDCGNTSDPSPDVCPIRLQAETIGNNDVSLTWSDYSGWSNGVANYVVEKYNSQGALLATYTPGTATSYVDTSTDPMTQVYVYVIKANAVDAGLGQAVSNEITITKKPTLRFPSAFTPDGTGDIRNEVFKMICCNLYIQEFDLKVFNRWGELIYSTSNTEEGWDGTYREKDQPEGTYAFVANIRDLLGKTYTRSGSIVLLRKN